MRNSPVKDRLVNVFMSNPQISIHKAAIEAKCSPSYAHKVLSELRAPTPDYAVPVKVEHKPAGLLTAWQCGALGLICFAAGGLLGAIKCL